MRAALAGATAAALAAAAAVAPAQPAPAPSVRAATTGRHSELVETIPITPRPHAGQRVAMSLTPGRVRPLAAGERLLLNGEVQVTLSCARPGLPRSVRVPAARPGDVLAVYARQVTDIGALSFAAYISDEIIIARSPRAVRPTRPSPGAEHGYATEANGFNCTQGPSQFQTPCASAKAGVIAIRRARGRPYYVNLVSRAKPKHSGASPGDVARIDRGGWLRVILYR